MAKRVGHGGLLWLTGGAKAVGLARGCVNIGGYMRENLWFLEIFFCIMKIVIEFSLKVPHTNGIAFLHTKGA
ncbi:MAG: hypothetical protein Q7T28_12140 [Cypionkella sp.]|nr:hypothetical protein [Cypionkella sp.]